MYKVIYGPGQGKGHYAFNDEKRVGNSYFIFAYWCFNTVSYFKHTNFTITEKFTRDKLPNYIDEAINKGYYYS